MYNFSAGPATLPETILLKAQEAIADWQGRGISILSLSHRSDDFMEMAAQTEQDLRDLLNVPDHYHVLFLAGGATQHFAMTPLNLSKKTDTANYVQSGYWSKKAITTAQSLVNVHLAAEGIDAAMHTDNWSLDDQGAYLHITPNETIEGIEFTALPRVEGMPIVADLSSNILSRPIDIASFGLIYAGAQKNIGPAGFSIAIIREDLLSKVRDDTPPLYRYKTFAEKHSLYNTPATFAWYVCGLTFKWLKEMGGLQHIYRLNQTKAALLYNTIDQSDYYTNTVPTECRSLMNVCFTLKTPEMSATFIKEAKTCGCIGLKGHRSVGGMRASLYNAMPLAGVQYLCDFMIKFEKKFG